MVFRSVELGGRGWSNNYTVTESGEYPRFLGIIEKKIALPNPIRIKVDYSELTVFLNHLYPTIGCTRSISKLLQLPLRFWFDFFWLFTKRAQAKEYRNEALTSSAYQGVILKLICQIQRFGLLREPLQLEVVNSSPTLEVNFWFSLFAGTDIKGDEARRDISWRNPIQFNWYFQMRGQWNGMGF